MEKENRVLESFLFQFTLRVRHEKGVTVVHWIAQLESEHGICLHKDNNNHKTIEQKTSKYDYSSNLIFTETRRQVKITKQGQ